MNAVSIFNSITRQEQRLSQGMTEAKHEDRKHFVYFVRMRLLRAKNIADTKDCFHYGLISFTKCFSISTFSQILCKDQQSKTQNSLSNTRNDKEKHHFLPFKKLYPANV